MTAQLQQRLAEALAGRYRVERTIGAGGMATVFVAHDERHDRPVALKVLRPELAAALGADRFLREIRLAARLQHPHILGVYDSGVVDATPTQTALYWYAMPFIEGESLRDRMERERPLPIGVALRIGREIAEGLDYAHRQGVLHRDIKPENILLQDGHALIADFGIARALQGGDGEEGGLTLTGMAIGTPAYMSPEQATGARGLDARSDVYSVGCLLYEMLAGLPPYSGPTAQAVIVRAMTEEPPSLAAARPEVQPGVVALVAWAMAKEAEARMPSAGAMAEALAEEGATHAVTGSKRATRPTPAAGIPVTPKPGRPGRARWIVGGLVAAAAVVAGVLLLSRGPRPAPTPVEATAVQRLAVLPFDNLGAAGDEYFADGVADAVRGKLTQLGGVEVIARASSVGYRRSPKPPREIAAELDVRWLLTGTVRWEKRGRAANRVQVQPELVDARTGAVRWQEPFDAALTDVFQVQSEIASRVVSSLGVALGAREQELLAERPTSDVGAYEQFLLGETLLEGRGATDPAGLRAAIAAYERAVRADSTFWLAQARLAAAWSALGLNTAAGPEAATRARQAAQRAIALAPQRAAGHVALGIHQLAQRDFDGAAASLAAARRLAPSDPQVLLLSARLEAAQGRIAAAARDAERYASLDPRSSRAAATLASLRLREHRLDAAAAAADRALGLAPASLDLLHTRAMVELARGDLPAARAVLRRAPAEVSPEALAAYVSTFYDLVWVLDDSLQALALRLPVAAFDGDPATRSLVRAQLFWQRGEASASRAAADSAAAAFATQLARSPGDGQLHALRGLALALAGRTDEALAEAERGTTLVPIATDTEFGPYVAQLRARVELLAGRTAEARRRVEQLYAAPFHLTPEWVRIDPGFRDLR
ncbi:MAG: serine/threonine-protein kinase [Gemmatimonadales bacterium]|nr:serine/threonine-protein kinase [Gemmatimonadales bacterium]